jgi:hypothetical protein
MEDGSEDTDLGAQTDSAIASGDAGVAGYGDATDIRLDDWEGGNLAAAAAVADAMPMAMRYQMMMRGQ